MSATDFEVRHQTLLISSLSPSPYERSLFAVATLLIGAAAAICPLGSRLLLLVAGRAFLDFRLIRGAEEDLHRNADDQQILPRVPRLLPSFRPRLPATGDAPNWRQALRQEPIKWGLFLTMIIFTVLLVERVA